jgi:3-hydroxyisobutyrate dehydrogenase
MAREASKILTMLPSTPQVESVYLDPKSGILVGLQDLPPDTESLPSPIFTDASDAEPSGFSADGDPHTILIDQTTLDPTFAVSLAEQIRSETLGHAVMLDAPVSGGQSTPMLETRNTAYVY